MPDQVLEARLAAMPVPPLPHELKSDEQIDAEEAQALGAAAQAPDGEAVEAAANQRGPIGPDGPPRKRRRVARQMAKATAARDQTGRGGAADRPPVDCCAWENKLLQIVRDP